MDIQRIIARTSEGDTIDATSSRVLELSIDWKATIEHAEGGIHEDIPVKFSPNTIIGIEAALQEALDSCPHE